MIEPSICPECGSHDTGGVDKTFSGDEYTEVWECDDCTTQYEVKYEAFEKEAQE